MVYMDHVHLVADSLDELHEFAQSIGLRKHYFHGVKKRHPHYDLTNPKKFIAADLAGAKHVSKREILRISKLLV